MWIELKDGTLLNLDRVDQIGFNKAMHIIYFYFPDDDHVLELFETLEKLEARLKYLENKLCEK